MYVYVYTHMYVYMYVHVYACVYGHPTGNASLGNPNTLPKETGHSRLSTTRRSEVGFIKIWVTRDLLPTLPPKAELNGLGHATF